MKLTTDEMRNEAREHRYGIENGSESTSPAHMVCATIWTAAAEVCERLDDLCDRLDRLERNTPWKG